MRDLLIVFLPLYFAAFFGFAFLWRTWRTWKATGVNPYRLPGNPGVEQITSRYFRLLPVASLAVVVAYLVPGWYAFLGPLVWLEHTLLQLLGIVLMTVALVVILVAQGQMGESWRIGVDYQTRTVFVQRGLFRYSRNPVFVGILLSVLGMFLALPNALTLVILMLDLSLIQVQVQVEEAFLAREHGEDYAAYRASVRRWL